MVLSKLELTKLKVRVVRSDWKRTVKILFNLEVTSL